MAKHKDKFSQKQAQLIARTAAALSIPEYDAAELLKLGRRQSIRVNTLKLPKKEFEEIMEGQGFQQQPFSWMDTGYRVNDETLRSLRDSELSTSGSLYIQNAASWLPVVALDPQSGETVLDVCAAPGGKTSHIASLSQNSARIMANDNSKARLHKLQANMQRLGVENIDYTLHDATRLAQKMNGQEFDKILLDAPCSGEGMMTLDNRKDFESWSVAHIKRLQQLQKRIIVQAWELLKPGGTLVYSTCTMAPEENEAVVDYLLRRFNNARLAHLPVQLQGLDNSVPPVLEWNGKKYSPSLHQALRLRPSPDIEAFFVAVLVKSTEEKND